mgnify:CR=1 FL=1
MKPKKPEKSYTIIRKNSGYLVVDQNGNQITDENVWVITIKKLEQLLRAELGL